MIETETIVVGGGPAGSTCAWKLRLAGREVIVLDRSSFPRPKPCAGWITPRVLRDLQIAPAQYPHTIARFGRLHFHIRRLTIPLPTVQYAIRRVEFDHWLLQRAAVPVYQHEVRQIIVDRTSFVIDGEFRCRYLVGAGGTTCPVYRSVFRGTTPRISSLRITAMENEFISRPKSDECHLWFGEDHGYSWYVPKARWGVNMGVGVLASGGSSAIHDAWGRLVTRLAERRWISADQPRPEGSTYYLRQNSGPVQLGRAFIIGDAAGLATRDMGEGIGPAVQSGILAAQAILRGKQYSVSSIPRYSLFSLLWPGRAPGPSQASRPARGR